MRAAAVLACVVAAVAACSGAGVPAASPASSAPVPTSASPASASPTSASPTLSTPSASVSPTQVVPESGPWPVRSPLFGLHPVSGFTTIPAGSWRLWDSGTGWPALNPSRGHYNWAPLDSLIQRGRDRGVKDFVIVLGLTPRWAASNPSKTLPWDRTASPSRPKSLTDYYTFVTALAEHNRTKLGGAITGFQVWNEANLSMFWTGGPDTVATMTGNVDRIIKSVDRKYPAASPHRSLTVAPSVTLRRGSLSPWSDTCQSGGQPDACFFGRYLQALASVKGYGNRAWPVDAFAMHTYPHREEGTAQRATLIASMKSRLSEASVPTRALWDTEVNYGLREASSACRGGVPCIRRISGLSAMGYVGRTYMDSIRLRVARTYWYAWGPANDVLGIVVDAGTPASRAFAGLEKWLVPSTLTSCRNLTALAYVCQFTKSGTSFKVAWTDGPSTTLAVPAGTEVCPLGGTCTTTSKTRTTSVPVTAMPTRLT